MDRVIFIGDVHGCLAELAELLLKLKVRPEEGDKIVFIGDLIHKGPLSREVTHYIRNLIASGWDIDLILGNHEEKHLRWLRHEATKERTGKKNPTQHTEEYAAANITPDIADWIRENSIVARRYGQFLAVHGGVPKSMPALDDFTYAEWREMSSKDRKHFGQVLRCRWVNAKGKMVSLDDHSKNDIFWADQYDGRFGTVVFGHNPFFQNEPKKFPHAYGIDLGCVHGNKLCALNTRGEEEPTWVTVDAYCAYKEARKTLYG